MAFGNNFYVNVGSDVKEKNGILGAGLYSYSKGTENKPSEKDFSRYCTFVGAAAEKAKTLKKGDRIQLLKTVYDEHIDGDNVYPHWKVLDFAIAEPKN